MLGQSHYSNGQKTQEQIGDVLIVYFKNGIVKAKGQFINKMMEGEWEFYRENGLLWQIGHFSHHKPHGIWIRYNIQGKVEYTQVFNQGRKVCVPSKK